MSKALLKVQVASSLILDVEFVFDLKDRELG
jgi:hypothetical protein